MSKQDVYQVSCLVGRSVLHGQLHYRVRWQGYSSLQDTWEPLSHLSDVFHLVTEYDQCTYLPSSTPSANIDAVHRGKRAREREAAVTMQKRVKKLIH